MHSRDGDYLVTCARSGFTCYRSECRRTWDNKLVRADFWESRHPQDIIRSYADNQSVPDGNPEPVSPPLFEAGWFYDILIAYDDPTPYEYQSVFTASMVI